MLQSRPLKIIVDTNLWVSFVISKKLTTLDSLLFAKKIRLLFSSELIAEIKETVTKPKLKKHFVSNALEEMLLVVDPFVDLISVVSEVTICRDVKDNFLLALAKDGKADYLLTGDFDLLCIKKFGKTKIGTITDFIEIMKSLK